MLISRELNTIVGTRDTFKNILEMSKTALFLKQQVKYLQTKRYEILSSCFSTVMTACRMLNFLLQLSLLFLLNSGKLPRVCTRKFLLKLFHYIWLTFVIIEW